MVRHCLFVQNIVALDESPLHFSHSFFQTIRLFFKIVIFFALVFYSHRFVALKNNAIILALRHLFYEQRVRILDQEKRDKIIQPIETRS